ncbi:MAG: T9SS type A sorting domain-containing protein, partial [Ignavibacteria bacterium]|nr:T9SS type A sorting domain-containing protein [Ignavibacteria bacterium]
IEFAIPRNGLVEIKLFDILGREVSTLVSQMYQTGYHSVQFDASSLSSGAYFYRIVSGDYSETKKMLLVK